jgi:hypothetical protein
MPQQGFSGAGNSRRHGRRLVDFVDAVANFYGISQGSIGVTLNCGAVVRIEIETSATFALAKANGALIKANGARQEAPAGYQRVILSHGEVDRLRRAFDRRLERLIFGYGKATLTVADGQVAQIVFEVRVRPDETDTLGRLFEG